LIDLSNRLPEQSFDIHGDCGLGDTCLGCPQEG
jgi:hypothetical protein